MERVLFENVSITMKLDIFDETLMPRSMATKDQAIISVGTETRWRQHQ
jgi:hypothetical protein